MSKRIVLVAVVVLCTFAGVVNAMGPVAEPNGPPAMGPHAEPNGIGLVVTPKPAMGPHAEPSGG